ncbi:hypothetical protein DPMN_092272 [Dreissena polymorpha]|uniref:Uncharacterized protein n=1 Tax=Dreissena polymorpha TaxID=45954 RepID=A0A9D4R0Q8_DREPO|nr:hypothetical protein DPMN_092272 [Dreissena polymorpha]
MSDFLSVLKTGSGLVWNCMLLIISETDGRRVFVYSGLFGRLSGELAGSAISGPVRMSGEKRRCTHFLAGRATSTCCSSVSEWSSSREMSDSRETSASLLAWERLETLPLR